MKNINQNPKMSTSNENFKYKYSFTNVWKLWEVDVFLKMLNSRHAKRLID